MFSESFVLWCEVKRVGECFIHSGSSVENLKRNQRYAGAFISFVSNAPRPEI